MAALAAPLAIADVGWVAMQIVDIAVVGRIGPEAIGAVGVGSALFLAFGVFGMGMLAGLDPLISQAFGARRPIDCNRWLRHGLCVAVALTVPLTLLGRAVGRHLDVWGFDADVLEMTRPYFHIVIWSLLPLLLYAALRRYLQAVNAVRPVMAATSRIAASDTWPCSTDAMKSSGITAERTAGYAASSRLARS